MTKLRHFDLFSGIGGFSLGLERTGGFETVGFCEIEPFCRAVLKKHWPNVWQYDDIKTLTKEIIDANCGRVDCITGGFPCQDISNAGKRAGIEGERSGLWSEMYRIICEIRPRIVVMENSAALLFRGLGRVLRDLALRGFNAEWRVFSAYEFGSPHERERAYIVAYSNSLYGCEWMGTKPERQASIFRGSPESRLPFWIQAPRSFVGMDDGVSARAYRNRVGAIGNAVVPQVVTWIGHRILESMNPSPMEK